MLSEELRAAFSSTLCRAHPRQGLVEVAPAGGTLVIFDPVVVPHEVLPVLRGERLALFGFFAEERRVPLAWDDADAPDPDRAWFHDGRLRADDG